MSEFLLKTLTSNESLKSEVATKQKIDQSGIFFENRLKESLLPANQKSAFIHVVKNAEAFLKNAPLENVDTRQIADLLEVLKNSPSKSVHTERYETLSKALNDALTQAIKNSQNQPLFSLSDKLGKVEQLTTSKDLGGFKMALKELVEEIKNPLTPKIGRAHV